MVWRGSRCMSGWRAMRRAGWAGWRTGRRGRGRARIRCPPRLRRGSRGCGGIIPGWGPSRIVWEPERAGVVPLPGRPAVYRALIRHGLVDPKKRRRRREDYRRWERGRAMQLWQMDVMGRVHLAGGAEVKVVTGIDDHFRFVVCARAVLRATARPVCLALAGALRRHGIPGQILTGNGKVFTARFGRGPGPVMSDRICAGNGIKHLTAKPYPPATTGKAGRLHQAMRAEFFRAADGQYATPGELQQALDRWVSEYNTARPHQSCGARPPSGSGSRTGPSPRMTPPRRRSPRQRPRRRQRAAARRGCRGG
jgi:transposase InsO family protein